MSGPPDAHVGDRDQNRGGALVAAVGLAFGILEARLPARDRARYRDFMGDKEIRKLKVSRAHLKSRSESLSCQCINMTKLAALVVVSGVVGATDCQRIAEPSTISVHELHTVAHAQRLPIQNFEDQSLIDSWRERFRRSVFCCSIYCERVGWTVGSARRLGSTLP